MARKPKHGKVRVSALTRELVQEGMDAEAAGGSTTPMQEEARFKFFRAGLATERAARHQDLRAKRRAERQARKRQRSKR